MKRSKAASSEWILSKVHENVVYVSGSQMSRSERQKQYLSLAEPQRAQRDTKYTVGRSERKPHSADTSCPLGRSKKQPSLFAPCNEVGIYFTEANSAPLREEELRFFFDKTDNSVKEI